MYVSIFSGRSISVRSVWKVLSWVPVSFTSVLALLMRNSFVDLRVSHAWGGSSGINRSLAVTFEFWHFDRDASQPVGQNLGRTNDHSVELTATSCLLIVFGWLCVHVTCRRLERRFFICQRPDTAVVMKKMTVLFTLLTLLAVAGNGKSFS